MSDFQLVHLLPNLLLAKKHISKLSFSLEGKNLPLANLPPEHQPLSNKVHPIFFTDRDDTINHDGEGYQYLYSHMDIFPQAYQRLKELQKEGYLIVVVTNQSGIARAKYTVADFVQCMQDMASAAYQECGLVFDAVLFAPALDVNDSFRKPNLGAFNLIQQFFPCAIEQSFMLGDSQADITFGKRIGLQTITIIKNLEQAHTLSDSDYVKADSDYVKAQDNLQADYAIAEIKDLHNLPFFPTTKQA